MSKVFRSLKPSTSCLETLRPSRAFMRGFARGLGSVAEIFQPRRSSRFSSMSDVEGLRRDWRSVGDDFRRVLAREYANLSENC